LLPSHRFAQERDFENGVQKIAADCDAVTNRVSVTAKRGVFTQRAERIPVVYHFAKDGLRQIEGFGVLRHALRQVVPLAAKS
jgi:hypothetical protein